MIFTVKFSADVSGKFTAAPIGRASLIAEVQRLQKIGDCLEDHLENSGWLPHHVQRESKDQVLWKRNKELVLPPVPWILHNLQNFDVQGRVWWVSIGTVGNGESGDGKSNKHPITHLWTSQSRAKYFPSTGFWCENVSKECLPWYRPIPELPTPPNGSLCEAMCMSVSLKTVAPCACGGEAHVQCEIVETKSFAKKRKKRTDDVSFFRRFWRATLSENA